MSAYINPPLYNFYKNHFFDSEATFQDFLSVLGIEVREQGDVNKMLDNVHLLIVYEVFKNAFVTPGALMTPHLLDRKMSTHSESFTGNLLEKRIIQLGVLNLVTLKNGIYEIKLSGKERVKALAGKFRLQAQKKRVTVPAKPPAQAPVQQSLAAVSLASSSSSTSVHPIEALLLPAAPQYPVLPNFLSNLMNATSTSVPVPGYAPSYAPNYSSSLIPVSAQLIAIRSDNSSVSSSSASPSSTSRKRKPESEGEVSQSDNSTITVTKVLKTLQDFQDAINSRLDRLEDKVDNLQGQVNDIQVKQNNPHPQSSSPYNGFMLSQPDSPRPDCLFMDINSSQHPFWISSPPQLPLPPLLRFSSSDLGQAISNDEQKGPFSPSKSN